MPEMDGAIGVGKGGGDEDFAGHGVLFAGLGKPVILLCRSGFAQKKRASPVDRLYLTKIVGIGRPSYGGSG
jgi:hypothetical protein